jgi:hypothetical protein
MRLLGLRLEVDGVSQSRVEQLDGFVTNGLGTDRSSF